MDDLNGSGGEGALPDKPKGLSGVSLYRNAFLERLVRSVMEIETYLALGEQIVDRGDEGDFEWAATVGQAGVIELHTNRGS